MAGTQIQRRRGTTAEHASFTGAVGEITVDTTKKTAVVHDGATAGGVPLAREDLSNVTPNSLTAKTTPVDADLAVISDSAASYVAKKLTFANLWAWVQTKLASPGAIGGTTPAAITGTTITGSSVLTNAANASGYTTGAGGTVTQATSKSTAVTLNKPCGQITMNNAALAAGATVSFALNNSLLGANDILHLSYRLGSGTDSAYRIRAGVLGGLASIYVENISGGSLSEAISMNFAIIKGVTA